jgi:hypothetical protein
MPEVFCLPINPVLTSSTNLYVYEVTLPSGKKAYIIAKKTASNISASGSSYGGAAGDWNMPSANFPSIDLSELRTDPSVPKDLTIVGAVLARSGVIGSGMQLSANNHFDGASMVAVISQKDDISTYLRLGRAILYDDNPIAPADGYIQTPDVFFPLNQTYKADFNEKLYFRFYLNVTGVVSSMAWQGGIGIIAFTESDALTGLQEFMNFYS